MAIQPCRPAAFEGMLVYTCFRAKTRRYVQCVATLDVDEDTRGGAVKVSTPQAHTVVESWLWISV